ncbi:hypothetical protein [Streptomyces sp. NPDC058653]|uniref:hypothetical protein n=1 Tax=Streptomyces sp. NPDC058653 TaxID=3346576 RepID=UPI00365EA9F3
MTQPTGDAPTPPSPEYVDSAVLTGLLKQHGWHRRGGAPGRYSRWTPPSGDGTSLLVPDASRSAYADHGELLGEALTALSRSSVPSAREVLDALTIPGDKISWRRVIPRSGAAVSWTAAEQLRSAARGMLVAATLAAVHPAGWFGARHRTHAARVLDEILVGPAPAGHLLSVYAPVPDGRPTATTLLRALQTTRDAVDYTRTTGGLDPFDDAVALGVSHELVRALVKLVRGTEGVAITLAWSPLVAGPRGFARRPEPVEFSPGDIPTLMAAADHYREREPSVPVSLTGTVVRLRRPEPSGGGIVRLQVLAGADVRQVRIQLDEESYRIAAHAHLVGLPLRISGRLESSGGFRRLTEVSGITPLDVDEAERDRLLKALQSVRESFEDACAGEPDC